MKQTTLKEVSPLLQRIINWSSIIGALGTLAFCIWAYFSGILQSKETLSSFILQAGIFGPPLFIFLQILQTVVPIIPGALTSVAGVFIYGHIIGTIYNYIGIVIGCAIIFYLSRMYGPKFVQSMVSQKTYDKYVGWLNEGKRFDRFFIFMMIWPISPADFICMLAGLTNMTFKRYMTIIILCKPITLVIYTYGLTYIIDYFWKMV
ncbi:TVP38/TMEM64 family protein [Streptococcus sp. IMAU 99161]|uniref:TVP38/TMEM64 family protein n=1 Tax=Streptococcus sp. IMAU 99161 TaxID=2710601 RepID=UPI00165675FA|nr:TVP38/TMEM64 family protein [Streptococcus sp. IMAU 99161]MBC8776624.1 TVP38/TMEM64 family protein [Streptococcus sp. IMAU 99161]